ncbi:MULTISPECIES: DUF6440 family protein [Exiguobacterium]|uniref:DUF6440 family protein n=1 Tax=Exiguobacterium alkaliphilum TaxID=1428684 RepID=A0ABT2KYZ6_9BACL|nr:MULTISPECIES: DUF6440 family protein [Exiguobacterium]MCT4781702.1 DUF6440 family protein [Exiguobacterium himgiriensis]MCT4794775.1 DUF6440 family protein [Exiguobacterium alkaliphilum]
MLFKKKAEVDVEGTKRFVVKLTEQLPELGQVTILVDTATGVNYIQTWVGTSGGITPLVDANGDVVVDELSRLT